METYDVLLVARALTYFVFAGTAAVVIAVLAHLLPAGG
jgi:hypothetical protein